MQSFDEALGAAARAAQHAWPDLPAGSEEFLFYLRDRLPQSEDAATVEKALASLQVADLYLAWACTQLDAQALRTLEERFLQPASALIARIDPTPDFADEVMQRVRQRLLLPDRERPPRLLTYSGRGTLLGWIRAAVLRIALNHRRDLRFAAGEGEPRSDARALGIDPELANIQTQHQQLFKDALAAALHGLSLRERTLLRLHLVEGVGIDRLSPVFAVHRATVARWIAQAKEALLAETRRRLQERAGLAGNDLASFLGALGSGFDLSLSRLLAASPESEHDDIDDLE